MSVKLLKSLLFKSARIQREIEQEQQNRKPDSFRLLKLKKIRLMIKDRLQRLIALHQHSLGMVQPALRPVKVRSR